MLYIPTKFCEIISNCIKVIERTRFLYGKLQRGIIPQKMEVEWRLFISAHRLVMLYISTKFCEIISKRYQSYKADTISILKISKGNNSAKNLGGVTVVNLCMLSDRVLYLCQVSWNYLKQYQSYGADTNVQPLTDGRTEGQTDTQKFGGYNIIPRHFLWRGIKRWSKGNINSEIELYSSRSLQNPGFLALALKALEIQS